MADAKRYYLYRVKYEETPSDIGVLPVAFFPPDCPVRTGDGIIVFQSQSLRLLGDYMYEGDTLIINKELTKSMKDYFGKLSFIKTITEHSQRALKKRAREITKDDFLLLRNS
jgi:hypothetical protein